MKDCQEVFQQPVTYNIQILTKNFMNMLTEYGCEKCGAPILKTDPVRIDGLVTPPVSNMCDDCGHVTDIFRVKRFQWSAQLQSEVNRLCTYKQIKELRLNPQLFIDGILNKMLAAAGKRTVEVDASLTPSVIQFKK